MTLALASEPEASFQAAAFQASAFADIRLRMVDLEASEDSRTRKVELILDIGRMGSVDLADIKIYR